MRLARQEFMGRSRTMCPWASLSQVDQRILEVCWSNQSVGMGLRYIVGKTNLPETEPTEVG